MLRVLLCLVVLTPLLAAQEDNCPVQNAPPPPPPPKAAERPPTPSRIRVGGNVQAAPLPKPAPQWQPAMNSLSEEQIGELEATIAKNPHDVCARGYLIAHGVGHVSNVTDHVLWMIANHPEWDGFLAPYPREVAPGARDRV